MTYDQQAFLNNCLETHFCMLLDETQNIIYLFINYNTITNYILIIYELSNFDREVAVV